MLIVVVNIKWGPYETTTSTGTSKNNRFNEQNKLFCTFLCLHCTTTT